MMRTREDPHGQYVKPLYGSIHVFGLVRQLYRYWQYSWEGDGAAIVNDIAQWRTRRSAAAEMLLTTDSGVLLRGTGAPKYTPFILFRSFRVSIQLTMDAAMNQAISQNLESGSYPCGVEVGYRILDQDGVVVYQEDRGTFPGSTIGRDLPRLCAQGCDVVLLSEYHANAIPRLRLSFVLPPAAPAVGPLRGAPRFARCVVERWYFESNGE